MTIENLIITSLLILLVAAVGYALYIKHRSESYTRERYAFAALASSLNLVALAIATVTSKKSPWTVIREIWSTVFGSSPPPIEKLELAEQALILVFIAFVIYSFHRTFDSWTGAITAKDKQRQELHEEQLWPLEGMSELVRVLRRQPPSPLYAPPPRLRDRPASFPVDNPVWWDSIRDLVQLRWPRYIFPEDGWHDLLFCWVGRNKNTDATIALLCVTEIPSDEQLSQVATYVARLPASNPLNIRYLVVVRDSIIDEQRYVGDSLFQIMGESLIFTTLVDFSNYFDEIERRVSETLPESNLTLPDIYVVPSLVKRELDARKSLSELQPTAVVNIDGMLANWIAEQSQRHVALLGEYGQGKSTATLMLTHRLIQRVRLEPTARTPILIELRGMSPSTLPPLQLLGAWCSTYRIDPRSLMKLIAAGRVILIFDGFDEMAEASDPEARLNHFRTLWKFAYPRNKIVITGRPNFFLDDIELKTALGVEQPTGTGPYCEAWFLKFFELDEIRASLRNINEETRKQIIGLVQADKRFLDIVARPSLLYIVAILWEIEDSSIRSNPNSAEIIELFIRHSYRRQSMKADDGREFMDLSPAEREYFMDGIAGYMVARRLSNQIQLDQLREAVAKLFEIIPDRVNLKQHATQSGPTKPLKERLRGRINATSDVEHDVRSYGLLVQDPSKPAALRFAHKQFFEFIFARMVAQRIMGLNQPENASIATATGVDTAAITEMPESLNFLGEILSKQSRSRENAANLAQSLFDAIVLKNILHFHRFIAILTILETPLRAPGSFFRSISSIFLKPSFFIFGLIGAFSVLSFYGDGILGILFRRNDTFSFLRYVFIFVGAVLEFGTLGSVMSYFLIGRFGRIENKVNLWYLVIRNMGITKAEVESLYGRWAQLVLERIRLDAELRTRGEPERRLATSTDA